MPSTLMNKGKDTLRLKPRHTGEFPKLCPKYGPMESSFDDAHGEAMDEENIERKEEKKRSSGREKGRERDGNARETANKWWKILEK